MPPQTLTVSQITGYIKSLFTMDPMLTDVWVSGEVSNFRPASSGHCYFTLKDGDACLKSVIWRTTARNLRLPRDGDAVVAHGYVSVYERDGAYQFYIDRLEQAGAGVLWQEFERLRARLTAEGLFDGERKRPIPERPGAVGIVTSASAAALRDILRTLSARYPLINVVLAPCAVQGSEAPPAICAAIQLLNRWSVEQEQLDVILVARGGGSIEELWAFNDERVARAIAASAIPVITGVGHETDFTIADFTADLRAATPTAAAAACTPDLRDIRPALADAAASARAAMDARLAAYRAEVVRAGARTERASPLRRLSQSRQRVDDTSRRAVLAFANTVRERRARLQGIRLQLNALDPARVLDRGYAIVIRDGAVVTSVRQVNTGDALTVRVADGAFGATVSESHSQSEGSGTDV